MSATNFMSAQNFMPAENGLRLYNTLTRTKEDFSPIDPNNVRMYVCGPTVYDFAHIGNARPVIVFDVLFRLLRHLYGDDHVTYVRNITDVDDKINARALRDFGAEIASGALSLNEAIRRVTETTANQYQADVKALGCLEPTFQPRATEFVAPRADGRSDMITLIQRLIERGHAYEAAGEVLFDTASMPDYGQLSKRNLDEQQAGARVAVDAHKKNPGDFVLWKLSSQDEPGWPSPWGRGRPGWHIECSAMSAAYLGEVFDIHGGGLDLIFPHHENEIAQSRCAHGTDVMANVWMHNGFLQVEGQKMSKSLGNFVTMNELLETDKFGGFRWPGQVVRYAMLKTHYRQPIDFSVKALEEASTELSRFWRDAGWADKVVEPSDGFLEALCDDLNLPRAIAELHRLAGNQTYAQEIRPDQSVPDASSALESSLFSAAQIIANLKFIGIDLRSYDPKWPTRSRIEEIGGDVAARIATRLAFIRDRNWVEADRIRDELLADGIQLKDGKDPATGERITTWEVKR